MTTADTHAGSRLARLLTELGGPAVVLVALPIAVGAHAASDAVVGLLWGLAAATFFGLIPFGYVLAGARVGRWADHHVPQRTQRARVFVVSLISMLGGLVGLSLAGAPRLLTAVLWTLVIGAVLALVVTLFWKVSLHMWVLGTAASTLVVVYGPRALLAWPVIAAVGWSRVAMDDHSTAQVLVGAAAGSVAGAAVLLVLL